MALIIKKITCILNISEEPRNLENQEMFLNNQDSRLEIQGQGLDVTAQQKFESLLGYDLEKVMIFANPTVDQALDSMSADAAALGSDIFVKQSKFNPGSSEGEALLAHEMTHVAQFLRQGSGQGDLNLEQEALQTEHQVRRGALSGKRDGKEIVGAGLKPASTGSDLYSRTRQLHTAATDRTYWPKEQTRSGRGVCVRWPNGRVDRVSQQILSQ
ncbi:DUF4157 domain-containing protein, partial [bacterium]|nr:DUF4157 domain-containing protein [bacterium]